METIYKNDLGKPDNKETCLQLTQDFSNFKKR